MARYARQAIADIPYHILNRGNNRQDIFFDKHDYQFFLRSLELAKGKYPCKIYSFALMPNHVHLLIEPVAEAENLAYLMKHISQKHGQYINKKYGRTGTLWEGRFKSSPISTDHYLLTCSRYIEMNPVRSGMVKIPEQYEFSSYRTKIGLKEVICLDFDPLYLDLGKTEVERQKNYRNWIREAVSKDEWDVIKKSIQRNWAYGNDQFKGKMENTIGRRFEIKKAGRKPQSNGEM